MKLSHRTLIGIAGLLWFAVGLWLMRLGIQFLMQAVETPEQFPFLSWVSSLVGKAEQGVVALMAVALFVGFFKGRMVLSKTVNKTVSSIKQAAEPVSLNLLFTPRYLVLITIMMGIGFSLRFFSVPLDIRGFVDVAVGSALINGAMLYFRSMVTCGKECPVQSQKP